MNEKKFYSFYKLNDEEIKQLEENNIRNSAPVQPVSEQIILPAPEELVKKKSAQKNKIVAVAVSLAVVIFGVMIGINAMPDRNSGNKIFISEPDTKTEIKTEEITTKKTETKKEKNTFAKTESATEKTTELVNNEAEIEEIKINMNRHYCTHCDVVFYNGATKEHNLYNSEWGIPFSLRNIYVDENEMLIGLFEEDFDLSNVEKNIDTHENKFEEDNFYFFDYTSTRYTIKDLPNDIEGIPEEVMPDYIVIDYSPEGDIAIGHRYCTRVHFCFDDKPIGYNFEFVKGKDLLEDEIETLKEHIKEYGLTE